MIVLPVLAFTIVDAGLITHILKRLALGLQISGLLASLFDAVFALELF